MLNSKWNRICKIKLILSVLTFRTVTACSMHHYVWLPIVIYNILMRINLEDTIKYVEFNSENLILIVF